jgi:transcriptional regulator
MGKPQDLVQGTLDLLILRAIEHDPKHGWAIAKRIQQVSTDILKVQQGSLYPALYRLERDGRISSRWVEGTSGRPTKVYALTAAGRRYLRDQLASWERLSHAINLVIRHA